VAALATYGPHRGAWFVSHNELLQRLAGILFVLHWKKKAKNAIKAEGSWGFARFLPERGRHTRFVTCGITDVPMQICRRWASTRRAFARFRLRSAPLGASAFLALGFLAGPIRQVEALYNQIL
jgi:hypothetical protein